jgi:hypothetical protein
MDREKDEEITMCYFITAYTQEDFCTETFTEICKRFDVMKQGVPANHKMPVSKPLRGFLFTGAYCDCDSPIGSKRQGINEVLPAYIAFFKALSGCKNSKSIILLKHWYAGDLQIENAGDLKHEKIHLDDIDEQFLLNIEDDVLYEIGLYTRYGHSGGLYE